MEVFLDDFASYFSQNFCTYRDASNKYLQQVFSWRNKESTPPFSGPRIKACNWKLFFLFLNQSTYVVDAQKNRLNETVLPSQWDGSFEHPKHMFKMKDKQIMAILRWKKCLTWPYAFS